MHLKSRFFEIGLFIKSTIPTSKECCLYSSPTKAVQAIITGHFVLFLKNNYLISIVVI